MMPAAGGEVPGDEAPEAARLRILGVDPGSAATGWAILEERGGRACVLDHGVIRTRAKAPLAERLRALHDGLVEVVLQYEPAEVAVEQVFSAANVRSALVLGHARGAALLAAGAGREVFEYGARAVKKAVVGYGQADKVQVARMVTSLLGLDDVPPQDAADALAIALCHLHSRSTRARYRAAR